MLELVLLLLAMHQLRMQTAIAIPGGIESVQQDRQIVKFWGGLHLSNVYPPSCISDQRGFRICETVISEHLSIPQIWCASV